ncbi:RCC1 domain-containing protein [Haliangium sp.]|uniref:RCC1 domain-containing protein n=1 Tax=Haliangium sp. TaxID=2663208 RepID=UPI003D0E5535
MAIGTRVALAAALSCLVACVAPAHDEVAQVRRSLVEANGLIFNRLQLNRLQLNRLQLNRLQLNRLQLNRLQLNGFDVRDLTHEEVALDAQQEADFLLLMQYLVECALAPGQSVTVVDSAGGGHGFDGSLGLAPEWASGPMSATGEALVSACLGARSNALGQQVLISLRGGGIPVSAQERDLFSTHEGVFWGSLFGDPAEIKACVAQGGGLSGRVCALGQDCGFTYMGDCASECTYDSASGLYTSCDGTPNVINTFVNLGHEIGFGDDYNCYTDGAAALWCVGANDVGQLGLGYESQREPSPVQVSALGAVAEVVGGREHTCARSSDGAAWCWGRNEFGRLGDGSTTDRSAPVQVSALGYDVASIGVFEEHSCAVLTGGSMWCWGRNGNGELGDGSKTTRAQPVQVSALGSDVLRASYGPEAETTCAIKADESLWCWGENTSGQVGNDGAPHVLSPERVVRDSGSGFVPLAGATDACSGASHTCARLGDGTVWCWGSNVHDQLGVGLSTAQLNKVGYAMQLGAMPAAAPGGLSCGKNHTCAVAVDGTLWCWGQNNKGALGDGGYAGTTVPVQVTALGNTVMRVSAADEHTCATQVDGAMWCWGADEHDLLFPGATSATPVAVALDTSPSPR